MSNKRELTVLEPTLNLVQGEMHWIKSRPYETSKFSDFGLNHLLLNG